MSTKKKYIDSHWLVFAFQGVIALLFGWFAMFTKFTDLSLLITIVGSALLVLGIVELFNLLHRTHLKTTWGLTLALAAAEIIVGLTLLFTSNHSAAWHLSLVSGYTLLRGLIELLIGLHSVDDRTDKAIWTISGICGTILAFAIFNSGNLIGEQGFIRFFGSYMAIYGLASLIYGVHNRDQAVSYREHLSKAAKKGAITREAAKKSREATKKSRAAAKSSRAAAQKTKSSNRKSKKA